MDKLFYFAYGSNLHPNWLRSRTPSAEILSVECSSHFVLHFNKHGLDDSGKCNIVASDRADDVIYGVVYRFNADEKTVLDEAERGYCHRSIQLGGYEDVLVYIADDPVDACSSPYSWYRDIVVAGARYHNLPEPYIRHIQSFPVMADPDPERDKRHRAIVWPEGN